MADLLKVSWSAEAIQYLSDIIDYLKLKWTDKEVRNFFQKLDRCIHLISSKPKLFPVTKYRKDLRRCILSKQQVFITSSMNLKFLLFHCLIIDEKTIPTKYSPARRRTVVKAKSASEL